MTAEVPDREAAAAQLDALGADQAALADRIVQPWWWDVASGLLFAGFISSYSAHRSWVVVLALVLYLAGLAGLVAAYRRMSGVWFDAREVGPVQDRVRSAVRRWVVGYVVLLAVGGVAEYLLDLAGAMVVVGVVLGVAVWLLGRWVSQIFAAGLRAGR